MIKTVLMKKTQRKHFVSSAYLLIVSSTLVVPLPQARENRHFVVLFALGGNDPHRALTLRGTNSASESHPKGNCYRKFIWIEGTDELFQDLERFRVRVL